MLLCRYLGMTTDVLTSVKKMEESLKRLKKAKGGTVVGEGKTLTDDDKIRLQFHLDVTRLGDYVSTYNSCVRRIW